MPELNIEIRAAHRDQLPIVRQLADVIWRAHYPGIITVEQIDYMLERGYAIEALAGFLGRSDSGLDVAWIDGEASGFAAWTMVDDSDEAKLDKLYVLPSRQRYGVGRRLIRHVIECARAAGAKTLILNVNKRNEKSILAYERCGFAIRDAVVNDIGRGFVMDDYIMSVNIA